MEREEPASYSRKESIKRTTAAAASSLFPKICKAGKAHSEQVAKQEPEVGADVQLPHLLKYDKQATTNVIAANQTDQVCHMLINAPGTAAGLKSLLRSRHAQRLHCLC